MAVERRDPQRDINAFMEGLYRAHDVPAHVSGDWVVFTDQPYRTQGETNRETVHLNGSHSLVLQITFCLAPTVNVVECFSGAGSTWEEACKDSLENFARNTFHVFVAAFFDVICGEQVNEEVWTINGQSRRISMSNIGVRGQYPVGSDGKPDMVWFDEFQKRLESQPLSSGLHWVRLFYMRKGDEVYGSEILLDNEPWMELEPEISEITWPRADHVYGFRLFLILQNVLPNHSPRRLDGCG
jgi:Family of unknown function (DUF6348)